MTTSILEKKTMQLSQTALNISPSGIRKFFDIIAQMPDCISLGVGEPDFVTPKKIIDAGIQALQNGKTQYTSNFGMLELRQAISAYLEKRFSVTFHPENEIIITFGVSEALDLALRAIINPGDEIIVPEPSYVSYHPNIQLLYGVPVPVITTMENEFQLKASDVERVITQKTKAILLNSPNNPTGAVIPWEELEKIAKLAKQHGFFVITDEIYSELIYDQAPRSIASITDIQDQIIFLNGFSKSYAMTGWRIGYVCANKEAIEIMMKIHQYTALCAPILGQIAAIEALKNAEEDKKRMVDEYLRRRNLITRRFNEIGLQCHAPGGAFYVFPNISSTGLSPEVFAERLLFEKKVAVVPGNVFGITNYQNVRAAYATNYDKIKIAMDLIEQFVGDLR